MKKYFMLINIMLLLLQSIVYSQSGPVDCNGEHTLCPIDNKYPYRYCEGNKIVVKCTHRPEGESGTPLKAPFPICIGFIDDNLAQSNFFMPDQGGIPQIIYSKSYNLEDADGAAYNWNCLCDKQNDECQCEINIAFSNWDGNFVNPSEDLAEATQDIDMVNCRMKCEYSRIFLNITDMFVKQYRGYFYNEHYQSNINNIKAGNYAYSLRETIEHELGHILGLLDYTVNGVQRCSPPGNDGVMREHGIANVPRESFSNDDKCYFKNLYCGEYTTKIEEEYVLQKAEKDSVFNFPNPSSGLLEIHFVSKSIGSIKLELFDFIGKNVLSFQSQKTSDEFIWEINISDFAKGLYNYSIQIEGKMHYVGKFLISN